MTTATAASVTAYELGIQSGRRWIRRGDRTWKERAQERLINGARACNPWFMVRYLADDGITSLEMSVWLLGSNGDALLRSADTTYCTLTEQGRVRYLMDVITGAPVPGCGLQGSTERVRHCK